MQPYFRLVIIFNIFLRFKCSSKILAPGKGVYEETDLTELHVMHKKLEDQGVEKESIKQV